jgi:hypothetical protein
MIKLKGLHLVLVQILIISGTFSPNPLLAFENGTSNKKCVSIELFGGTSVSMPMPLDIRQDGYDDLSFTAHYETKAFNKHPYYSVRLGRWDNGKSWEVELVHHKIHLTNNPPEIKHFEVSHGYNLLTVNRAWEVRDFIYRVGLGVVVAHPESTVRNKEFYEMDGGLKGDGNYYVAGPTAQIAIQKKFGIWGGLFGSAEAKFTASYATVPIAEGEAVAPNTAFHFLAGIGYNFGGSN